MWETAFDPSMLTDHDVIISCPDADLAEELMNVLAENGVVWDGSRKAPTGRDNKWTCYTKDTCFWVENFIMSYGSKQYAEDAEEEDNFKNYIKCTFYGIDYDPTPDIEITDDEFFAILMKEVKLW